VELRLGETADLPNGLGTVRFDGIRRFASLDIAYNPGQIWVLFFAMLSLAGITVSLTTPRRRVWVRQVGDSFEVAGLSRRDDPRLEEVVRELTKEIKKG
jgi:cytochrome c biogenesis protein